MGLQVNMNKYIPVAVYAHDIVDIPDYWEVDKHNLARDWTTRPHYIAMSHRKG